jgi:hypothetical protein
MLGMKTYSKKYIDACRARVGAALRTYRKQAGKPWWYLRFSPAPSRFVIS